MAISTIQLLSSLLLHGNKSCNDKVTAPTMTIWLLMFCAIVLLALATAGWLSPSILWIWADAIIHFVAMVAGNMMLLPPCGSWCHCCCCLFTASSTGELLVFCDIITSWVAAFVAIPSPLNHCNTDAKAPCCHRLIVIDPVSLCSWCHCCSDASSCLGCQSPLIDCHFDL